MKGFAQGKKKEEGKKAYTAIFLAIHILSLITAIPAVMRYSSSN